MLKVAVWISIYFMCNSLAQIMLLYWTTWQHGSAQEILEIMNYVYQNLKETGTLGYISWVFSTYMNIPDAVIVAYHDTTQEAESIEFTNKTSTPGQGTIYIVRKRTNNQSNTYPSLSRWPDAVKPHLSEGESGNDLSNVSGMNWRRLPTCLSAIKL